MEWIDVDNFYPSNGQKVLMTYNDLIMEGEFANGKFYHPASCAHVPGFCKCEEQEGITHWMHLPDAPKMRNIDGMD